MNNSISFKSELSEIKQLIQTHVVTIFITLTEVISVLASYLAKWGTKFLHDFSFDNIRQLGLVEVLYRRAMLFFGLEEIGGERQANRKEKIQRIKRFVKKAILFPLYMLITLVNYYYNSSKIPKKRKKVYKKVNSYHES